MRTHHQQNFKLSIKKMFTNKRFIIPFLIFDLVITAGVVIYFVNFNNQNTDMKNQTCITNYHTEKLYGTGSSEYTNMLYAQEEFKASDQVNSMYDTPSFHTSNGDLLIGTGKSGTGLVVNSKYFSDLKKIDLTKLSDSQTLGTFKDLTFSSLKPKQIFEFLINSQLLGTFIHIEANLCMTDETNSESLYQAKFEAEHIYYTNERNVDKYSFVFTLDKTTGEIQLGTK